MTDSTIQTIDEDDNNYSFRRLLNLLTEKKEIIITINKDDEKATKRNLTALKSKDASKFKAAGLDPGDEVLTYTSYPVEGDETKVNLRITLAPRKGVAVHSVKLPDDVF